MIIGDGIIEQEKKILTEILYNREVVPAWDFREIGKIKKKIAFCQKTWTVEHKAWQVPSFWIPQALISIVIDMLQERLKMRVIEPCHFPH